MTRASHSLAVFAVPLVVGLGVGGVALFSAYAAKTHETLPTYGRVPAFALVDQDGRSVSRDTLHGSVWIADFIFTRCAGQCPMMSAQMARLAALLAHRPGVRLVSFTVDPAWDTPEVLARYAAQYRTSDAAWSFLTGDEAAIQRLCREGFRVALSEQGTEAEPITHSTRLVLVDRRGHIRGYYEATDEAAMRQLRHDLRRVW